MTKRYLKSNITKRKRNNKNKSKKICKNNKTKKIKYGGESEEYKNKAIFRRKLNSYINQINNPNNSRNKIKEGINLLITFLKNSSLINTLIPISLNGKYVDKETGKGPTVDFVSPITFIFDNIGPIPDKDLIRILNTYYQNSGNFNNLSSRFKKSPLQHEIDKQRINNIRILLDKANPFSIIEEGLNEMTKNQLAKLIPNEQKIISQNLTEIQPTEIQPTEVEIEQPTQNIKLALPYNLPEDKYIGYDVKDIPDNYYVGYNTTEVPEFWKPIFPDQELFELRNKFMEIYEIDKYKDNNKKNFEICNILQKIIPTYSTKEVLHFNETVQILVNVNILNCFITLMYSIILYKLYKTKQDYLFIFKGGRALQLSLVNIDNIGKHLSEDTDILIIPNTSEGIQYDSEKMENLSGHIAYLVKWMIPQELKLVVSLPSNPKNQNKEITKLLYNDNKYFKALSDIGFGVIKEEIKSFFENYSYSPFYNSEFNVNILFITPTLDDILAEKIYFYSKYLKFRNILDKNEPIQDPNYSDLTKDKIFYLLNKFGISIKKLVEAKLKKENANITDSALYNESKLLIRHILEDYPDYQTNEIEDIITSIYPAKLEFTPRIRKPLNIKTPAEFEQEKAKNI